MEHKLRSLSSITTPWVWALAVLVLPLVLLAMVVFANDAWLFSPRPPVPQEAKNVNTYVGSMDWARTTEFETGGPAEAIQQFYRTELPKRGWRYLRTRQYNPPDVPYYEHYDVSDVYVRSSALPGDRRTLTVSIWLPGAWTEDRQERRVVVTECGRLGFPCFDHNEPKQIPTPYPTNTPRPPGFPYPVETPFTPIPAYP